MPSAIRGKEFFGHPKGLGVLLGVAVWERFAFYGNYALIGLYIVKYLFNTGHIDAVIGYDAVKGGLELLWGPLEPQQFATHISGVYLGLASLTPMFGGLVADRVLGQRRTVIIGAVLLTAGHFMMAFDSLLLVAMVVLILGVGGVQPNTPAQLGALYGDDDPRRDRGYSIVFAGINIGISAGFVCGALATRYGPHYGFVAAGTGMLISLLVYLYGLRWLPPDEIKRSAIANVPPAPLDSKERRALLALVLVSVLSIPFWATYEQNTFTLPYWLDDFTDRSIDLVFWRGEIPSTAFLALSPLMVLAFTPVILKLWAWQAAHGIRRTFVTKMAFACWAVALANLVMAAAAFQAGAAGGKASAVWPVVYFALITVGELYLAPVALSLIATIAPPRMRSLMMGVWLAASVPGSWLGGALGSFWSPMSKPGFFLMIAAIATAGGFTIWPLRPLVWAAWPNETQPVAPPDPG
jgi:POT family proton-dependent oligopeptide transporter